VQQIHLAWTAVLEQADHRPGCGRMMRRPGVKRTRMSTCLIAQEMRQRQRAETAGVATEEGPASAAKVSRRIQHLQFLCGPTYSTYKNALLARIIWQKSVQAR